MISLTLDSLELAEKYDVLGHRQFEHGKLLIRDLGIAKGQHVLDAGCGTGLLAAFVAGIVGPEGRVIGIDPLPLRIELARKKGPSHFQASVGKAEDLSAFDARSFDVAYLNSVMHWLPDKCRVLSQIRRVLRPGGLVGFTVAAKEGLHSFEQAWQRALITTGLGDRLKTKLGIPSRSRADEVSALFVQTGFEQKDVVLRTFTDHFGNVDDPLAFSTASSFGNHLAGLTDEEVKQVREVVAMELESCRDPQGIRQERHILFAIAKKPRAVA